jgi:hypothetical protein
LYMCLLFLSQSDLVLIYRGLPPHCAFRNQYVVIVRGFRLFEAEGLLLLFVHDNTPYSPYLCTQQ